MCLRIICVFGQIGSPDQCPKRLKSTRRVTNFFSCTDPPLRRFSEICVCLTDGGDSFVHDSGTLADLPCPVPLADLPCPVRSTCLPVLPPSKPIHPFHVRKPPLSMFLLHPTLPPRSLDLPMCHVHQFRGPCDALTSRHEVCEIDF